MNTILKETKIPVRITPNENNRYLIEGDASKWCGNLHFSHEFTFSVSLENEEPKFLGGWECACEEITYSPDEDGVQWFEEMHPGLYKDVLEELKNINNRA